VILSSAGNGVVKWNDGAALLRRVNVPVMANGAALACMLSEGPNGAGMRLSGMQFAEEA